MNISINPSYFCNFSCDFCYLTESQLRDQNKISTDDLDRLLSQVKNIDYIDLYGGEIGALKDDYYEEIKSVIRKYYDGEINIVTNLSVMKDSFIENDISLTVSYDFEKREKHEKVFENMLMLQSNFSILILATKEVMSMDVDNMILQLNILSNLTSVEIKPYSSNQANASDITHKEYEDFIIKWIESPIKKNYRFGNEEYIKRSLNNEYNAYSDDHVYITPNGKFGVLEFDKDDREYFLELETFDEYKFWAAEEKIGLSSICKSCKYLGRCLTEHYRYVETLDSGCSGYKGLLEYYD